MLQLKSIVKDYQAGSTVVHALKGVSLNFRESEFVSVLGHSGCGKTTLLNIVGGLDKYTSGDLVIDGVSTKEYTDRDWDNYRNHSVGFIFQTYNLIMHQSVVVNVELALTLSGINKKERKKRAIEALEKVGLGDQVNKMPNQLSGGQMQRVAIARALVNNPKIILADEPTGALDTETSVQIMEILKEISKDRLIIMVTHNPDIAKEYSSRIINLKDGLVIGDDNPYEPTEKEISSAQEKQKDLMQRKVKKPSMSFLTALSLSFKNLFTKKGRTILTSFAGSIGIIGIALILSLSSGFQNYIDKVQEDTLSGYPITISRNTVDYSSILNSMSGLPGDLVAYPDSGEINVNPALSDMIDTFGNSMKVNNLRPFKTHLDQNLDMSKISAVKYGYSLNMNYYSPEGEDLNKVNLAKLLNMEDSGVSGMLSIEIWGEMLENHELIKSQYDLVGEGSRWNDPQNPNEVMLTVDKYNRINDYALYNLGLIKVEKFYYNYFTSYFNSLTLEEFNKTLAGAGLNTALDKKPEPGSPIFDLMLSFAMSQMGYTVTEDLKLPTPPIDIKTEILGKEFKVVLESDFYEVDGDKKLSDGTAKYYNKKKALSDNITTLSGTIAFLQAEYAKIQNKESDEAKAYADQIAQAKASLATAQTEYDEYMDTVMQKATTVKIVGVVRQKRTASSGSIGGTVAYSPSLTKALIEKINQTPVVISQLAHTSIDVVKNENFVILDNTFDMACFSLGIVDESNPSSISIYPTSFENKDYLTRFIKAYNQEQPEENQITYTDYLGIMMSSISTIINAISIVLICFVGISLVVSSIMIGIITYISVLERTKEIGVLRSIGASKKDVARVFNAETLIIGFSAGMLGILVTVLLCFPINWIIVSVAPALGHIAKLPTMGGIILVLISMGLTLIAGLIPSGVAAKKDPVIALRSE